MNYEQKRLGWLHDTSDIHIPCMDPECLPELDVNLSPTDTPNVYMGACPDCYTGYKLEIYPPNDGTPDLRVGGRCRDRADRV